MNRFGNRSDVRRKVEADNVEPGQVVAFASRALDPPGTLGLDPLPNPDSPGLGGVGTNVENRK